LVSVGFVNSGARFVGKILGILLIGIFYFIINKIVGKQKNFTRLVNNYVKYPTETKKRANSLLLIPFFILLINTFVLAFLN
jgi:hypothetical protein